MRFAIPGGQFRVQPFQLQVQPRVVFKAPLNAPQPVIQLPQLPQVRPLHVRFVEDDSEKLRTRIAELEAKVKQLEAELARVKK